MKFALALCVALLAVLLQAEDEMGPPVLPAGTRITNGIPATPGQLRYMAYFLALHNSGKWSSCCSGSLITRYAVLTAAYCVYDYKQFTVRLGSIYRTANDTNARTIVSILALMHPKYNRTSGDYNVAIIHLPREAPLNDFIRLVHLPRSPVASSYVGRQAIVSGWGETIPGTGMTEVLHWARLVVVPNDYCKKYFKKTMISDRQLCANSYTSTAWNGDIGSPLVVITRGQFVQIGIFFRYVCKCSYNTSIPTSYTSVTSFTDWIKLKTESDE